MSKDGPIYFMGIGGTGMASVAGLVQASGHKVVGSDKNLYPPMSNMLDELKIRVHTPYSPKNLQLEKPSKVVVANVLSRGHEELEYALDQEYEITSFPALLGQMFLKEAESIVVTGTHGKTTTTSLTAFVLSQLGEDPSFLIGGIPKDFSHSFKKSDGRLFVIEGDEYDTAFFDKGPKFLHYHPRYLLINNIEFDHADIYSSVEEIKKRFQEIISLVPNPENIIANGDDQNVLDCLKRCNVHRKAHLVSLKNDALDCSVRLLNLSLNPQAMGTEWTAVYRTKLFPAIKITTSLPGYHNQSNISQVLGLIDALSQSGAIRKPSQEDLAEAIHSFQGVTRRLELLEEVDGIKIYEDFAHHPTAVGKVIEGLKKSSPSTRLLVAFEPKNATSRRNIFADRYVQTLASADKAYIGACPEDKRIEKSHKMNTSMLAEKIGPSARAFNNNEELLSAMANEVKPGDAIVFMSSGSFSGVQYKLANLIKEKFHS